MTGEVTLRGKVLPVGGIEEKDLVDIPVHIRMQMKFVLAREVGEVLDHALYAIVLARAGAIPVDDRRARVRERVQKRRERIKPRAVA